MPIGETLVSGGLATLMWGPYGGAAAVGVPIAIRVTEAVVHHFRSNKIQFAEDKQ